MSSRAADGIVGIRCVVCSTSLTVDDNMIKQVLKAGHTALQHVPMKLDRTIAHALFRHPEALAPLGARASKGTAPEPAGRTVALPRPFALPAPSPARGSPAHNCARARASGRRNWSQYERDAL